MRFTVLKLGLNELILILMITQTKDLSLKSFSYAIFKLAKHFPRRCILLLVGQVFGKINGTDFVNLV